MKGPNQRARAQFTHFNNDVHKISARGEDCESGEVYLGILRGPFLPLIPRCFLAETQSLPLQICLPCHCHLAIHYHQLVAYSEIFFILLTSNFGMQHPP